MLEDSNTSKGQRKRLKKKAHMLKKKHFSAYLNKKASSNNERAPSFNLNSLGEKIQFMELDLESEMNKMREKKIKGVNPGNIERVSNQEIVHMQKVFNSDIYQKDPLSTIRQHLLNSLPSNI